MPQYAARSQLAQFGLPSGALTGIATADQDAQLQAASVEADTYIARQKKIPLVTWDLALTKAVCKIAAWDLLVVRGVNPDGPDSVFEKRHDEAIAWLKMVAEGKVQLGAFTSDSTPHEDEGGPEVWCDELRNW